MATNNALNIRETYPSFRVYLGADQVNIAGDASFSPIDLDTVVYDTTSSFNTVTHIYTAPISGVYVFNMGICLNGMTSGHTASFGFIYVNSYYYYTDESNPYASQSSSGNFDTTGGFMFKLTAGNTIKLGCLVRTSTKTVSCIGGNERTFLSGYCVAIL